MNVVSENTAIHKQPSVATAVAVALLGTFFWSFALTVTALWIHLPLSWYVFPVAVVAAIVTSVKIVPGTNPWRLMAWTLGIILVSILIGLFTIDYSYDGLYYHQEMIAALCDGWNPFAPPFDIVPPYTIWAVNYAKAVEISAASIVACTGFIEAGKAINFIAMAAMGAGVYAWLENRQGALSRHRWLLTLAAVANPVAIQQLFTYCMDFYKYIYLVFVLLAFSSIVSENPENRRRGCIVLAMSLILAMGTKFNIFFEAGVWVFAALLWWGVRREWQPFRIALLTGLSALAIGAVLTFHPYVTNFIQAGHPLYPLMGEGAEDIMTSNTPIEYLGASRFVTFIKSLCFIALPNVSQQQGGFTPFMPLILLLSVWMLFKLRSGVTFYILAVVFSSCFFFEQAWWARYICQLWLVPVIIIVAATAAGVWPRLSRLTAWLMIAAGVITFLYAGKQMLVVGGYQKLLIEAAAEEPEVTVTGEWWGPQFERQFEDAGVKFRYVDSLPDTSDNVVLYFHEYSDPLVAMSPEGADKIRLSLERLHLNYKRHILGSEESIEYISNE